MAKAGDGTCDYEDIQRPSPFDLLQNAVLHLCSHLTRVNIPDW